MTPRKWSLLCAVVALACGDPGGERAPIPTDAAPESAPISGDFVRLVEHADRMSVELPARSIPEALERELDASGGRVVGEVLEQPCSRSIVFPSLRLAWWLCRTRYPIDVQGRTDFRAMTSEEKAEAAVGVLQVEREGVVLERGSIRQADAFDSYIATRLGINVPIADAQTRGPAYRVDYRVDPNFVAGLDPSHATSDAAFVVREVSIGGDLRPALFAPAPSELSFPVSLPRDAQLSLAVGVLPEGWFLSAPIGFEVVLRFADGREERVFEKQLDPRARASHRRWMDVQLDLSEWSGRDATLVLKATGDGQAPAFAFAAFGAPVLYARPPAPTPVVVVNLDTLRPDHLELYGYSRDTSPALSAFARAAVVFEQAIAQAPWTLPSQLSILTGLYPAGHGVRGLDQRLSTEVETLGTLLGRAGYLTRAIGDAGAMSSEFGFQHGFDSYWQTERHRHDYLPDLMRRFRQWFDVWTPENFLLFLHTYEPHEPYAPPQRDLEHYDADYTGTVFERFSFQGGRTHFDASERERQHLIARYDGEIRYTDRMFGDVMDQLKARGLYDRALILVMSDHGEEFGEHGGWLHGHSFYDELLRVPLLIKFPAGTIGPMRIAAQVEMIDVLPTVLEFLGVAIPAGLDGVSLLPRIRGDGVQGSPGDSPYAISDRMAEGGVSVRSSKYKLVQMDGKRSFYALEDDPQERHDVYDPQDPTVREFVAVLDAYLARARGATESRAPNVPAPEVENQLRALGYLE